MTKRILSILLALTTLLGACCLAEGAPTADERAEAVFLELADLYDGLLEYLEERQVTWTALLGAKAAKADGDWFINEIWQPTDKARSTGVISTYLELSGGSWSSRPQDVYEILFLPLYDHFGHTNDGLAKACFAFTMLVFYDEGAPERLEAQKAAIRQLMGDAPDYAFLSDLQNLYKKTSVLLDYVRESSDSYAITAERLADFQQTRRELKSDFDFIFDWPAYAYKSREISPSFKPIYDAAAARRAAEAARQAEEEAKAARTEEEIIADAAEAAVAEGFEYAEAVSEGLLAARKEGRYFYVNVYGEIVLDGGWVSALGFRDGLAWVKQSKDGKYGCINKEGELVIPCEWDHCMSFRNGFANAEKGGKWVQIDKTGAVVGPEVPMEPELHDGLRAQTTVYTDASGKIVLDGGWTQVRDFSEGYAAAKKNDRWGIIDVKGKAVIDYAYDSAFSGEGYFTLIKDGKVRIVAADGTVTYAGGNG